MERIDEHSYKFALRVVKLVSSLPHSTAGDVLGGQVLRSGTSIGANIEEAYAAASPRDFTNKMSIALKEARETHYWLRLIKDSGLITADRTDSLIKKRWNSLILAKTVITSKKPKTT